MMLMGRIVCTLAAAASFSAAFSVNRPYRASSPMRLYASANSLVVISPPGGVGEVSAVKAAEMGASVRWFVVSQTGTKDVVLSKETLDNIAAAGGAVELAGAEASTLLLPSEDPASALKAVSAWCGSAQSIICTFDGMADASLKVQNQETVKVWENAIKAAAQEAQKGVSGTKLTILDAFEDEEEKNKSGGFDGLVSSLLGGATQVPSTLGEALAGGRVAVTKLRHGQLFGTPESSPDFSPLVGGPRKNPELCEEYTMRAVRVDPTLSVSGNVMMGSTTRSSRHTVGEAAALMALKKVSFKDGIDVCVSSLRGSDKPTLELWNEDFTRLEKALSTGSVAKLFEAEFSSVPNVERLADWLASKWAPAVLRTYDIATIRSGARPVYARRSADASVDIVWQQLVDYESVTVGTMMIQVTANGLTAVRGPGDASKGFGDISKKPLSGEDVLVRRLADAASQAVEKGLATKVSQFDCVSDFVS
jgi:hypothetical protein